MGQATASEPGRVPHNAVQHQTVHRDVLQLLRAVRQVLLQGLHVWREEVQDEASARHRGLSPAEVQGAVGSYHDRDIPEGLCPNLIHR